MNLAMTMNNTCYDLLATGFPYANRQTDRLAQTLVCKAAVRPMRGFVATFRVTKCRRLDANYIKQSIDTEE